MKLLILADIHDSWTHLKKMVRLAEEMDGVIFLGDLMSFRKYTKKSIDNLIKIKERSNWMIGIAGNGALPKVREFLDDIGINLHGKGRIIEDIGFFGVGGVQDTRKTISEIRDFFNSEDTSNLKPDSAALGTLNAFGITYENGSFVVEEWSEFRYSALEAYASPFEQSEEKIYEILSIAYSQVQDASKKTVISHVPPYEQGIIPSLPVGLSTGSKAVTRFIQDHKLALSLSGHYHRHHEFKIDETKCIVVPAVTNGFYGILSSSTSSNELQTEIRKF